MNGLGALKALRRFWWALVLGAVVALGASWLVSGITTDGGRVRPTTSYIARTYLISTQTETGFIPRGGPSSPEAAAAFVTIEPIPSAVKEKIGFAGSASTLANMVTATVNEDTGIVQIEAVADTETMATQVSTTFADELLLRLSAMKEDAAQEREAELRTQIRTLSTLIAETDSVNEADLVSALEEARAEYQQLRSEPPDPGFEIINPEAEVEPVETTGFQAPRSVGVRAGIAIALGLLGGAGIALLLGRFDTRMRTKDDAQEQFGVPVLAEIPADRRARGSLFRSSDTGSGFAESFRILATEIVHGGLFVSHNGATARGSNGDRSKALIVTSPGPSDGKTTVAANLALALAEIDRSVIILSCDFRRPRIHELFGVSNDGDGLAEALRGRNASPILAGITRETPYERLRLVPSGTLHGEPIESLSSRNVQRAIDEARARADFVIIDTAPILAVSDASLLVSEADAVLVVARAGRTTSAVATSCAEQLLRLGANVIGVALTEAAETIRPRGSRAYAYARPSSGARGGAEDGATSREGDRDQRTDVGADDRAAETH